MKKEGAGQWSSSETSTTYFIPVSQTFDFTFWHESDKQRDGCHGRHDDSSDAPGGAISDAVDPCDLNVGDHRRLSIIRG